MLVLKKIIVIFSKPFLKNNMLAFEVSFFHTI